MSIVSIVSQPEGGTDRPQHTRGGQDSLRECVLSFHPICPRDSNEVIRFGGLYLQPHWRGGLLRFRGSFHLPRFPGGGDDFRMTSACHFNLIRKTEECSQGSRIQRRLPQRGLYPKPTANLFGNSALAFLPLLVGRCSGCSDNRRAKRGICKSCFSSPGPFLSGSWEVSHC